MVIDGKAEFVGSDTGRSVKAIGEALNDEKGNISIAIDGDMINVSIEGLAKHNAATIFLAVTEDGITSSINGGENSGVTLSHSAIVRSLTTLGVVDKDVSKFESRAAFPSSQTRNPKSEISFCLCRTMSIDASLPWRRSHLKW